MWISIKEWEEFKADHKALKNGLRDVLAVLKAAEAQNVEILKAIRETNERLSLRRTAKL